MTQEMSDEEYQRWLESMGPRARHFHAEELARRGMSQEGSVGVAMAATAVPCGRCEDVEDWRAKYEELARAAGAVMQIADRKHVVFDRLRALLPEKGAPDGKEVQAEEGPVAG